MPVPVEERPRFLVRSPSKDMNRSRLKKSKKDQELSATFVIEELGMLRSRVNALETTQEDFRNEMEVVREDVQGAQRDAEEMRAEFRLLTDAMNRLTSHVDESLEELKRDQRRRKASLSKAAEQTDEVMKICTTVADNIKKLQRSTSDVVRTKVMPLKEKVDLLTDRAADSEVHFDRLESSLNDMKQDMRNITNNKGAQTEISGGFLERAVIKLQGSVTSLQEDFSQMRQGVPNKQENDGELKNLRKQMKGLIRNTSDTCTHLSSGLTDVQASTLNLFAWAQDVDKCLEFNRNILGMGPNSKHTLPRLNISTSVGKEEH